MRSILNSCLKLRAFAQAREGKMNLESGFLFRERDFSAVASYYGTRDG
jgi:hypothetical protein